MTTENRLLDFKDAQDIRASLLAEGHSVKLKLGGNSMFPFLRAGDVGTVIRIPVEELKIGQVVVFQNQERWIAHRLVDIKHNGNGDEKLFVTQGDSAKRTDAAFYQAHYLGVVVSFNRHGKHRQISLKLGAISSKMLIHLRPVPQLIFHLFLRVRNRLNRGRNK
ncbi:MAG: signal peptidase I [Bacteroidia bacterium]|jgi:signal peptidase I